MNAPVRFTPACSTDACDRVLAAVRWWFREKGRSPSYGNIERLAGVHRGRVSRYLDVLQSEGFLCHCPGEARSIVLLDRTANLSDAEIVAAAAGRNMVIHPANPISIPLGNAIPADTRNGTDCPLSDLLAKLDNVPSTGGQYGAQEFDADPIRKS